MTKLDADQPTFVDELNEADRCFQNAIKQACETAKTYEEEERMIGGAAAMHTAVVRMIIVRLIERLVKKSPDSTPGNGSLGRLPPEGGR